MREPLDWGELMPVDALQRAATVLADVTACGVSEQAAIAFALIAIGETLREIAAKLDAAKR